MTATLKGHFMGVFSSDGKSRAQRRAEAKALKKKAKLEAKLESKDRRKDDKKRRKEDQKLRKKQLKQEAKAADKATKAQVKVAKAEAKTVAAKAKATADAKRLSPANVRRYLTVARLLSPVLVPIAYRSAVAARGQLGRLQAQRAGVAPELLQQFSGHGAALAARIATARSAVQQVSERGGSEENATFVSAMTTRLDNLATAVDAAETMPAAQRRTAHQSINDELTAIDADVLARLGVSSG